MNNLSAKLYSLTEGVRIAFNIEGKFWELGHNANDSTPPDNTHCWKWPLV